MVRKGDSFGWEKGEVIGGKGRWLRLGKGGEFRVGTRRRVMVRKGR